MFGRRKKLPPADVEFVTPADEYQRRLAADPNLAGLIPLAKHPVRAFYASRITPPKDPSWRHMTSCVILAADATAAHDQLASALRQRGSAAKIEDYVISAVPETADGRDYGIVLTKMVG